ncbi:hypothetical protein R3I94_006337 [Phoxinus phoxinus]
MDRLTSFGNDPFDKPPCRGCSSYLVEPYIKCAECGPSPFLLCLQCFTRGYEYKKHQSDHKYEIMTSDFPVLDPGWTAQEEMALLEAVMDCGFGNWQDVAYQMRTKTKEECEGHYMKNFINNPLFASTLLNLRQMEDHLSRSADTAIPFKPTDDPPRPSFDSQLSRDMAGYMPARADFMEEFDNYAEWDLKDIDFVDDDSDILHTLKVAVVDIYHSRLKERQRRKKIIRDHGLINLRKFQIAAGLIADSAAYSTPSKGAELQWWVKNHQGDFHRAAWHSWTLDTSLLAFASRRKPIKRSFSDVANLLCSKTTKS